MDKGPHPPDSDDENEWSTIDLNDNDNDNNNPEIHHSNKKQWIIIFLCIIGLILTYIIFINKNYNDPSITLENRNKRKSHFQLSIIGLIIIFIYLFLIMSDLGVPDKSYLRRAGEYIPSRDQLKDFGKSYWMFMVLGVVILVAIYVGYMNKNYDDPSLDENGKQNRKMYYYGSVAAAVVSAAVIVGYAAKMKGVTSRT